MINGIVGKHYGKIVKKLYRILRIKLCALYGAAASAVQIKPAVIIGKQHGVIHIYLAAVRRSETAEGLKGSQRAVGNIQLRGAGKQIKPAAVLYHGGGVSAIVRFHMHMVPMNEVLSPVHHTAGGIQIPFAVLIYNGGVGSLAVIGFVRIVFLQKIVAPQRIVRQRRRVTVGFGNIHFILLLRSVQAFSSGDHQPNTEMFITPGLMPLGQPSIVSLMRLPRTASKVR